jgi:glucosamine-6-phosphate deaminase
MPKTAQRQKSAAARPKPINLLTTLKGSLLENFYPRGWDLKKIDACCELDLQQLIAPKKSWDKSFKPLPVDSVADMDFAMGNAIADEIENARRARQKLAIILPVGPMGMYKTVVDRIRSSGTPCDHVTTFNMDEWSDAKGNTMPGNQPGGFEHAMKEALFDPLEQFTVPPEQRNFATKVNLPTYAEKIARLRKEGGRLVTVYGIGRVCHIAFWEPQLAGEYTAAQWKKQTHRLGVALHPLTVEQNSLHSFMSRFTLIPAFANTIGPGLFLQSDFCIGGADGVYPERGASWQSCSLCITLGHEPSTWLPSTWMPTMPGVLVFMKQLAGPLLPESH